MPVVKEAMQHPLICYEKKEVAIFLRIAERVYLLPYAQHEME
jgi:hypothetical protein